MHPIHVEHVRLVLRRAHADHERRLLRIFDLNCGAIIRLIEQPEVTVFEKNLREVFWKDDPDFVARAARLFVLYEDLRDAARRLDTYASSAAS